MTRVILSAALILLVLVSAAPASSQHALTPADFARVNAALVETHALPRYERLAAATEVFASASEAFCAKESDAGHEQLRAGFHDTMDAWMSVQHLRFGPVDSRMRGFHSYFWPQARAKAADAVAELVAAGETGPQAAEGIGQPPALEGGAVPKRAGLALQDRHVVPGIVGDLAAPARVVADARRQSGRPGG